MRSFVVMLLLTATAAITADWPQWRGPDHNGTSTVKGLPASWGPEKNIAWRLELPGSAPSTPVIAGDRLFLTSAKGEDLVLIAVSTEGKLLWERVVGSGNRDIRQGESNAAASSPSTDGAHVWAFVGTGPLACYDIDGEEIWKFDIQERYGAFQMYWGMATTPLLDGDRLYLALMHDNAQAVIALNAKTGAEIWKHERETDARKENLHSYASPVIYRHNGVAQLLVHGADYITAHSLADGDEIWRAGGMQGETYNDYLRFVASPVTAPGMVVVPSAKNGPVLCLKPDKAKGDITGKDEFYYWKREANTPDVPSPVIHDGLVYLCRENGILICMEAESGKEVYMERTHGFRHRGSPLVADGKVYLMGEDGVVTVVRAGREFEILASNDIGERTASSLAVGDGRLYLRTHKALYAIEEP